MDNPYPPASFSPAPGTPPPPAVKRKPLSFWLALFFGGCSVLAALVILVMFLAMGSAPGLGPKGPEAFQEQAVEGSGRDRIVWLPIHGVLMHAEAGGFFPQADLIDRTIQALKQAGEDPHVKAVVLDVDSPGGGVTESDQIHHAVERLQKEHGKRVVVLMGDVAASGGYYLSAGADRILAHPTTITGSIGVISQFMNYEGLFEKIGLKSETVKSVKFKDIGNATRPMTAEDRALFQSLVDNMHKKFAGIVLDGRAHVRLPDGRAFDADHVKAVADGRIYTADEALANGLIDEIGYKEDALAAARSGLKDATVVEYVRRPNLFDLLGARSSVPVPAVSLDLKSVREILSPRLLFLWTAP